MSQSTATKSQVEQQLSLVFAMKKQLDLVYMQLNYFRDACRNVDKFRVVRKRLLDGHSQLDPSRLHTKFVEFERNYRYWRKRICKLDRQLLEINLYDKLYDLFDSLVIGKSIAAAKELIDSSATKDYCLNTGTSKFSNFSPTKLSTNTPQPSSDSDGNDQLATQSEEVSVAQTQQQRQMTISASVSSNVPNFTIQNNQTDNNICLNQSESLQISNISTSQLNTPSLFLVISDPPPARSQPLVFSLNETVAPVASAAPNSFNSIPMETGPLITLTFAPMNPSPQRFLIFASNEDPIPQPTMPPPPTPPSSQPDLIGPQAKHPKKKSKRVSYKINNSPSADIEVPKPFKCDQCEQRFQTVFKLNFHQRNTHEPKRFVCCFEGCDYADNNGGNLRRHFKTEHPKQTVQANKISKKKLPEVTPENDSLSGPEKTNSNQDSNSGDSKSKTIVNYCNWEGCNFSTRSKEHLKAHESIHTGERAYKCDFEGCGFTTHMPQTLSTHKFVHTSERPFQCDQCDKSFKMSISLKQHMLVHNVEPRFRCSVEGCDFGTQYSNCLKLHEMRVHIGERTFKCSECGKSYFRAASLNQHKRTHVSQFKCSFDGCDFISNYSTSIKIHEMRVHIGSPQFKCDWEGCNYATYGTTQLKYHRAIHTGESLYKCNWEGCQRTFRKKQQLVNHKQNHANPNAFRYRCKVEGCDFGNDSVAQMTKHLKIDHKDHKNLMAYLFEYP